MHDNHPHFEASRSSIGNSVARLLMASVLLYTFSGVSALSIGVPVRRQITENHVTTRTPTTTPTTADPSSPTKNPGKIPDVLGGLETFFGLFALIVVLLLLCGVFLYFIRNGEKKFSFWRLYKFLRNPFKSTKKKKRSSEENDDDDDEDGEEEGRKKKRRLRNLFGLRKSRKDKMRVGRRRPREDVETGDGGGGVGSDWEGDHRDRGDHFGRAKRKPDPLPLSPFPRPLPTGTKLSFMRETNQHRIVQPSIQYSSFAAGGGGATTSRSILHIRGDGANTARDYGYGATAVSASLVPPHTSRRVHFQAAAAATESPSDSPPFTPSPSPLSALNAPSQYRSSSTPRTPRGPPPPPPKPYPKPSPAPPQKPSTTPTPLSFLSSSKSQSKQHQLIKARIAELQRRYVDTKYRPGMAEDAAELKRKVKALREWAKRDASGRDGSRIVGPSEWMWAMED